MFRARPELSAQEREKLRVERLKARNEDRAKRLLNAKLRIYGRDTEALKEQNREKQEREQAERERELALDAKRVEEAKTLAVLERERKESKKLDAYQLAAYHKEQRQMKAERDAEELAYQKSDGGPAVRNTDTLFLQFHGEDSSKKYRQKMQQQQQAQWIVQQMREKEEAKKADKELDKRYEQFSSSIGTVCESAERQKDATKQQRALEVQEYNRKLLLAKKAKDRQRKAEEDQLAAAELQYVQTSKLLSEDAAETYVPGNPNRKVPYNFKGMSQQDKQKILDEQRNQIREKQERLLREKEEKETYESQQEAYRRQLVLLEREKAVQQQEESRRLARFHQTQKMEKNVQNQHLKKAVYQNPVSPEFFKQFAETSINAPR
mmetsp:Transcript_8435/g.11931  ORF Transcript_8435/g.11931 Transcript_8435/m.11931 type:complete len:379 (-) Transcript_8435:206-1342(-)|eukprot:CAMPEP_0184487922 /NCGR_PEP_ID=MMETSP0113_2-20130426/10415_1 /TAXON_ID=91329 /ORGANISM="Norrisiella sphaerica, Strain BC52" /LENGTH=378 /DNA_ID=CAMNT_0026870355 /DNA_START=114 /DNA_END=1250 /DNA_ORIENTATION=-